MSTSQKWLGRDGLGKSQLCGSKLGNTDTIQRNTKQDVSTTLNLRKPLLFATVAHTEETVSALYAIQYQDSTQSNTRAIYYNTIRTSQER